MRRILITIVIAVLVVVGLGSVALATDSGGGSTVTQARLERSLPQVFSNVYAQEAAMLGHKGVTPASLHAKAMCDNGGSNSGPGSSWVCLMSWDDPNTPMPSTGYGKFELNVHSNDCYTAGSPSSLVGYQTITDTSGKTVNNPAYEFDGCFDPSSDNTPTGNTFPSAVTVATTSLNPTPDGRAEVELTCATGVGGCAGTLSATAGDTDLGSAPFKLAENATQTLTLPQPLPADATSVGLALSITSGKGSTSTTLPVSGR
jgi:hypothetical protein